MSVGKISSVLTFKTKHMAYLFAVAVKYIFNDFFFILTAKLLKREETQVYFKLKWGKNLHVLENILKIC